MIIIHQKIVFINELLIGKNSSVKRLSVKFINKYRHMSIIIDNLKFISKMHDKVSFFLLYSFSVPFIFYQ